MAQNDYIAPEHALAYLAKADDIPHRREGEAVLLSFIPQSCQRVLDLGTGDGRLLDLLYEHCPKASLVGLDSSPTMLHAARERFQGDSRVTIGAHDLNRSLPQGDRYDAIVSSFAINHCPDGRKRAIYQEIYHLLLPGGVFCNLEHVASPTERLHDRFLADLGTSRDEEDPGNILLDFRTQLDWLNEIGFVDVDCYWKWMELALLGGMRPA